MNRIAIVCLLWVGGCGTPPGHGCPNATVMSTCADPQREPCHDSHMNACIICGGSGVSNGCIYDPSAPLDGGTAVCVSKCTDCGVMCTAS